MGRPLRVLIVEDSEADAELILREIGRGGFEPTAERVADGDALRAALAFREWDVVVSDYLLPGFDALAALEITRSHDPDLPFIVVSGKIGEETAVAAMRAGAHDYLLKDRLARLPAAITRQLEEAAGRRERRQLAADLEEAIAAERARARELAAANARLQILDRLKTDFLTFISHELRTPLNAMTAVQLFDPHGDPSEQQEVIELVRHGYDRLDRFIRRGLEYFLWLGKESVEGSEDVDLADLAREVVASLPGLAPGQAEVQIAAAGTPCIARGEREHLHRVLLVLIENAARFSPGRAEIEIGLSTAAGRAVVTVRDHGAGFPPELAEEIFRPFTVADAVRRPHGTGLSLAIARAIVSAHGGRIQAESAGPGRGATFTVELPRAASPAGRGVRPVIHGHR